MYVYLAASEYSIIRVLTKLCGKEMSLIHYISKTLLEVETWYLPLKRLTLALVSTIRKLKHYFQAYTIKVLINQPFKAYFRRADLSGRISKWAVEFGEFDIPF